MIYAIMQMKSASLAHGTAITDDGSSSPSSHGPRQDRSSHLKLYSTKASKSKDPITDHGTSDSAGGGPGS